MEMTVIKDICKMLFRRLLFGMGAWLVNRGIVIAPEWEVVVMSNVEVLFGIAFMVGSVAFSHVWKRWLKPKFDN